MDQRSKTLIFLLLTWGLIGCSTFQSSGPKLCPVEFKIPSQGSFLEVQLQAECSLDATVLKLEVQEFLNQVDMSLSLYRKDSELSQLNESGKLEYPSFIIQENLKLALEAHEKTEGAFNPLVRPWVNPKWEKPISAPSGLLEVENIYQQEESVEYFESNMALTFDGVAKGYSIDQVVLILKRWGINNFLVNFSGNMSWQGASASGKPWQIAVWNPVREEVRFIPQHPSGSISSSGTERLGTHLFDPRTQKFVSDLAATTVVLPLSENSAAQADYLSTATFILGPVASRSMLRTHFPQGQVQFILPTGEIIDNTLQQ